MSACLVRYPWRCRRFASEPSISFEKDLAIESEYLSKTLVALGT
jgi:hypothetical protein